MESTKESSQQLAAASQNKINEPIKIQIFLVNDEETKSCEFWIGLFANGPHSPNHLFYKGSLMEVFDTASKEGLSEGVPVMLSDTTENKSKYIYLLPQLGENALDDNEWIHNTVQAVKACKPATVGIYLSPEAMQDKSKSDASLQRVLKELIGGTDVSTIALFPGDYGTNSVLNVALSIKSSVDESVLVYH
jgi:hypothetical protein